jgi:hypothetical protein
LGEVRLTRELSLNALAPEDWWMGYVVGNAKLSYSLPLHRDVPTIMFVPNAALGGASFFFFKTKPEPEPDNGQDRSDVAAVNWDLLWSVYASLVVSL